MLRRWAEERIYRRTMQLAVGELRRASRTNNALEKLQALEVAERKLRDALWLRPEAASKRFERGLAEIERSRTVALREQGMPAVERLLEAAGKGVGEREMMLEPAGLLLSLINHYLPDDPGAQALSARFRELGGKQPPYQPAAPLSEMYHRPEGGAGCAMLLAIVALAALAALHLAR